jgi:integrase
MSNNTGTSEGALSWGHSGLDQICQNLKEFDSLLIVFRDPNNFKWAQKQARLSLIPKSQAAGLVLSEVNLTMESIGALEKQLESQSPDAIVGMSSEPDRDRLNVICTQISKLPVAVIALFQTTPSRWELFFENCVEINEDLATIRWRDGRAPVQMPFSITEENKETIRPLKDRIVIIGGDSQREAQLKAVLETTQYDIKKLSLNDVAVTGAALVIYEEPWAGAETEAEIQRLSALSTVFISSSTPMRAEDRIRCYRAGARLVLSDRTAIEELAAAVNAYLLPNSERLDQFAKLDNETRRLSARIRRETFWKKEDIEQVLPLYQSLVANHFRRAQLLNADVITILVKTPSAPKEIADAGWKNVFQKALVGSLVSGLRTRDLTFTVDDTLVVVISAVHAMATKPVLKRMQAQLAQLSAPSVSVDVIVKKVDLEAVPSDKANELLREVFKPESFNYKDINQWVTTV